MTLGEKIKLARKNAGLTQEQLAEKLTVSRPAVTKWESDKGIPDVENLKALSKLLNVSVDYLLSDEELETVNTVREPVEIVGKGLKKKIKDKVIRQKFPNAQIMTLLGNKKLTRGEKIIDNLLGFFTDAPFGTPELINSVKNLSNEYYLVVENADQYLVMISNEYMETHKLRIPVDIAKGAKFQIDDMIFTNCGSIVYG